MSGFVIQAGEREFVSGFSIRRGKAGRVTANIWFNDRNKALIFDTKEDANPMRGAMSIVRKQASRWPIVPVSPEGGAS